MSEEVYNSVVFVGQFPPPVNGLTTINRRVLQLLEAEFGEVSVFDTAPVEGCRRATKFLGRAFRAARACRAILAHGFRRRRGAVYLSGEAGLGNFLLIALMLCVRLVKWHAFLHHHNFSYIRRRNKAVACLIRIGGSRLRHVFLCEEMRRQFARRYRCIAAEAKSVCLSNAAFIPLPDEREVARVADESDPLILGMLSNLSFEKGVDTFIELVQAAKQAGIDVKGILGGPASSIEVARYISQAVAQCEGYLTWREGHVYGVDKERLFREVDVFVFPTRYDGEAQPLVLFEALSFGCEIVATDIACIGCDHERSPGATFSVESFMPQALTWLMMREKNKEGQSARRESAVSTYRQQKQNAQRQIGKLILEVRGMVELP